MKLHRALIACISALVPRHLRGDWRREWNTELAHRASTLDRSPNGKRRARVRLLRESSGAIWDALWLRSSGWHATRHVLREWRTSAIVVLSLGIAMGATIVAVGLADALLLKPPGVVDPDRLLTMYVASHANKFDGVAIEDYPYYEAGAPAFAAMAAYGDGLSGYAVPEVHDPVVLGKAVSSNYFDVLGVVPRLGTLRFPGPPTARRDLTIISEHLWHRLGADPEIVGKRIHIQRGVFTIIGVVPASLVGMDLIWQTDVWFPISASAYVSGDIESAPDRGDRELILIGRLRPGATAAQADAQVGAFSTQLAERYPATDRGRLAYLTPTSTIPAEFLGYVRPTLIAVIVLSLLTLTAAGSNAASLLLGQALSRRHEMLVRTALGASRSQLMLPILRESLLLALGAGALGLGMARAGLVALSTHQLSFGAGIPPPEFDFRPDALVILVACTLTIVAGLAVGLGPAWRAASEGLAGGLSDELARGGTPGPRRTRWRHTLVVLQTSVTVAVLFGVGLAWRSVHNLARVDLGFSAAGVFRVEVPVAPLGYTPATGPAFYDRLRSRVRAIPGVAAVTLTNGLPIGMCCDRDVIRATSDVADLSVSDAIVDDDYFEAMGIATLAGRSFNAGDAPAGEVAVVVNRRLAETLSRDGHAVGQRLLVGSGHRPARVVGVVANGKYADIDEEPALFAYYSLRQHVQQSSITVVVRARDDARDVAKSVDAALASIDPNIQPWSRVLQDDIDVDLFFPTLILYGLSGLAFVALLLAAVGLYGTVFYWVSQSRREIGVRLALGAQPGDLVMLVIRRALIGAVVGSAIGLAGSQLLLPVLQSVLFGIRPIEPGILTVVALGILGLTTAIAYVVARPWTRASAMDILRMQG